MLSRDARYVTAAVQTVIAWEWLVSGANKVLSGSFPQGLASTLHDGIKNNPNGWYVTFLQRMILPHSVGFGYLIEFAEVLIGVALFVGVLLLVSPVRRKGDPQYGLALAEVGAAAFASAVCALLCINFHFFMGDGVLPGIDVSNAYGEGISLDTLMPPLSLIILYLNLHVMTDMMGISIPALLRRVMQRTQSLMGRHSTPTATTHA